MAQIQFMAEQPPRSAILARLKSDTRPQHEQMEATVDIFKRVTSMAAYRDLLARFWGFYAPLEHVIGSDRAVSWIALNWPLRQKVPLLQRDLQALGLGASAIAQLPHVPSFLLPQMETAAAKWGCLYVLEGATLGGAVIARHLQRAFGLQAHNGAAFYNAYGQDVGPMWKSFGDALTEFANTQFYAVEDQIVASAAATFDCLRLWLVDVPSSCAG